VVRVITQIAEDPKRLMELAGIAPEDYVYVDYIVNHEAGWGGATTWNRAGSGAYGICQSLNPLTQLKWCDGYAQSRYEGWANAYRYWLSHGNW